MGRNLSTLFISQSYQFLTQISGSELQDGLGNTITGSLAITSSQAISASFATTASFALNAGGASVNTGSLLVTASVSNATITYTKGDGSTFQNTVNNVASATAAQTAQTANEVDIVADATNTSRFVTFVDSTSGTDSQRVDAGLTYNPFTNTLSTTTVNATTFVGALQGNADTATTASFALNAPVQSTSSLLTTASAAANVITFTKGDGSTFPVTIATGSAVSASFASTASLALNNVLTASSTNATITYTKGDGTTFTNVINNVVQATSASFATSASQAVSSSFAVSSSRAVSASFATSASVATSASFATSASQAVSSSYAFNSTSASFAISSSRAVSASFATSASQATTASFAQTIASGLSPTFANVTASNVLITGTASVALLHTTTISSSVIFSSGSNLLGDSSTLDTQTLIGIVKTSGSFSATGSAGFTGGDFKVTDQARNGEFDVDAFKVKTQTGTQFTGSVSSLNGFTGSLQGTASFATSASQAVSSSFATTASFVTSVVSASYALSASFATSASQAQNAVTASFVAGGAESIFTNTTGSNNAIGYASQFYSNTSPGTPGATLFVSSSLIFSNNVSASSVRNVAIVGGKNHQAYDIIGDAWAIDSSGIFGGSNHEMKFSGSNNAIIGGQSNDLEAVGLQNSVIVGGQSHRLYAVENSVILGGTSFDARTNTNRSAFIGGSGGTFDNFQDGAVIASNNTTFVGSTLNNVTVLSSNGISKNAVGTDITSSVVIAAVDGAQSPRNLNKPYTLYTERLQTFNGAEITGSVIITGSLTVTGSVSGNVLGNNTDTYTGSAAVQQVITLTQAEYNAIGSPNANTLYIISGSTPLSLSGLATTGSNTFVGNQTISGSLTLTGSATFTNTAIFSGSVRGEVRALSISSQTASLDCSTDNFFTLLLVSGSTTHVNPSNILPGQTINLRVKQASVASGSISFASSVKQVSGSLYTPTTTGSAEDIVTFISFDSTNLYLSNIKNFV